MPIQRISNLMLLLALAIMLLAWTRLDKLPNQLVLRSELANEPAQTETVTAPFMTRVGGVDYSIKPVYDYDLYGLVMSRHDSDTWWDYIHRETNDHLNVVDLCVAWSTAATPEVYRDVRFSNSQWICYVSPVTAEAGARLNMTQISNNHVLTDNPAIARALQNVRVGDQIHIRGHLSEYRHNVGMNFARGTSTRRDDLGDGACETIFVREFRLLSAGPRTWNQLFYAGFVLLLVFAVIWWKAPVGTGD